MANRGLRPSQEASHEGFGPRVRLKMSQEKNILSFSHGEGHKRPLTTLFYRFRFRFRHKIQKLVGIQSRPWPLRLHTHAPRRGKRKPQPEASDHPSHQRLVEYVRVPFCILSSTRRARVACSRYICYRYICHVRSCIYSSRSSRTALAVAVRLSSSQNHRAGAILRAARRNPASRDVLPFEYVECAVVSELFCHRFKHEALILPREALICLFESRAATGDGRPWVKSVTNVVTNQSNSM